MAKKQKQIQMEGIDNTPLAQNMTKATKILERIESLEGQLIDVQKDIQSEMDRLDHLNITHNGYHFKLERIGPKQAVNKLKMKKVVTKVEN